MAGIARVCFGAAAAVFLSVAPSATLGAFNFQTVYHADSQIAGAPDGEILTGINQVVLSDDGRVAAIAQFGGTSAITLNAPSDPAVNILAKGGDTIYGGEATFDGFANLAASSGKVPFVGESPSASGQYGLFRHDESQATSQPGSSFKAT